MAFHPEYFFRCRIDEDFLPFIYISVLINPTNFQRRMIFCSFTPNLQAFIYLFFYLIGTDYNANVGKVDQPQK